MTTSKDKTDQVSSLHGDRESKIEQIRSLAAAELGHVPPLLDALITDVCALFEGKWETHQKCQVGYHTLTHALDVALAAGRMIAGWNLQNQERIGEGLLLCAFAASFFHDSGYLKDREDDEGLGGKYTFRHVPRSMELAEQYLRRNDWPATIRRLVPAVISVTEFNQPPALKGKFDDQLTETVAKMVATADLIAQMSDVNYIQHIKDLFQEFTEAYNTEGREELGRRGVHVFSSVEEMIEGTVGFYRNFVLPRLSQLGGMSRYLITYYGEDRNPYLESIAANLAGDASGYQLQWRRIGEILSEFGAVTEGQIQRALTVQQNSKKKTSSQEDSGRETLRKKATQWIEQQLQGDCLGDILMQDSDLSPSILRQGVIAQILPADFTMRLNTRDLLLLLHIMILLQNIHNGRWIFRQLLELVNEILECEASSILQADGKGRVLTVTHATGEEYQQNLHKSFALDKGLAGWVFLHGKPSTINRDELEEKRAEPEHASVSAKTVNMLAVPLNIAGKRTGVIEALNKRDGNFTAHEMNILSLVANLLSQSLSAALWL